MLLSRLLSPDTVFIISPIIFFIILFAALPLTGIHLFQPSISLNQTQVRFILNNTDDLSDHRVVLITNPTRVNLFANLSDSNFNLSDLNKPVNFTLSPKDGPQEITISANGSKLLDLGKNSYAGQVQVYAVNDTRPNFKRLVGKINVGIRISPNPFLSTSASIDPDSLKIALDNHAKSITKIVHIHTSRPVDNLTLSSDGSDEFRKIIRIIYPNNTIKRNLGSNEDYFVYLDLDARRLDSNFSNGLYEGLIKLSYVDKQSKRLESKFATISANIDVADTTTHSQRPIAMNDSLHLSTSEDKPTETIRLKGSSSHSYSTLRFFIVDRPRYATLGDILPIANDLATVSYTPHYIQVGSVVNDSFSFKVNDGTLDSSPGIIKIRLSAQSTKSHPVHIVFAIDASGSMNRNDPHLISLDIVNRIINNMNSTQDKAAILSWNKNIDFSTNMASDFTSLRTVLYSINRHGGTNLDIGIAAATTILDDDKLTNAENGTQRAIIFFSDGRGVYTSSDIITSPSHQNKEKLYRIFPIGFNVRPGSSQENALKNIASSSGGKYIPLVGIRDANVIADAIIQILRSDL